MLKSPELNYVKLSETPQLKQEVQWQVYPSILPDLHFGIQDSVSMTNNHRAMLILGLIIPQIPCLFEFKNFYFKIEFKNSVQDGVF